MTSVDYFLHDNRTWIAGTGRDWAIKAATGPLATRSDLRSAFVRYCSALPSEQGILSGFGQAMGGIGSKTEGGYLLCVTLEVPDSFGRPSWATYGLWCPDGATLEHVLHSDPVASAHAVAGTEPPPVRIALKPGGFSLLPRRRPDATTGAVHAFDHRSSIRNVMSILLGALRSRTPLPDILGITASSRLTALGQSFALIYCLPLDERAERVFARHGTAEQSLEAVSDAAPARPGPVASRPSAARVAMVCASVVALVTAVAAVLAFTFVRIPASPLPTPGNTLAVCQQIDAMAHLNPETLCKAEMLQVLQKLGDHDRKKAREAVASMIEVRKRIISRQCPADATVQTIRAALDTGSIAKGTTACLGIRTFYGPDSEVRRWCDSLETLARAAGSFREPPRTAAPLPKNTTQTSTRHPRVDGATGRTTP
jgi:hypothetical protein